MSLAQFLVFRQHVGQTGGVGEQMFDTYRFPAIAFEFRDESLNGIGQSNFFSIHQHHEGGGGHRLRKRRQQEDGIYRFGFAKCAP
jgi:hypothetical protein